MSNRTTRRRVYAFITVTLLPTAASGAEPQEAWVGWFRGEGDLTAEARSVALDPRGFLYVAGASGQPQDLDVALVKYDLLGNLVWSARHVGSPGNDLARFVVIDSAGDPVTAGVTEVSYPAWTTEVVRFNADSGTEKWAFRYQAPEGTPTPEGLCATPDGGVAFVCSNTNAEIISTVKVGADGQLIWERTIPGNGRALTSDAEGNLYVTGRVRGLGADGGGNPQDVITLMYSPTGEKRWEARHHQATESGESIALAPDGSVVVAGQVSRLGTKYGFLVLVYDRTGKLSKRMEHAGGPNDAGWASVVGLHPDGDLVVTGTFGNPSDGAGIVTMKYGLDGRRRWLHTTQGPARDLDEARALAFDRAGNIYVAGHLVYQKTDTRRTVKMAVMKYAPDGTEQWVRPFAEEVSLSTGLAMAVTPGGSIYAAVTAAHEGRFALATVRYGLRFIRGDVDADGKVDLTDATNLLSWAFLGGAAPPCRGAGDANADGRITITDPVFILRRLFLGGPAIPAPTSCGVDPGIDVLDCEGFPACP